MVVSNPPNGWRSALSIARAESYWLSCPDASHLCLTTSLAMPVSRSYNEVHTHAERKEEAMKRKAGEARSRQRRQRKQQEEQAAKRGESQVDEKGQGADRSKAGLSRRARSKQERDEKALSHRPARPLLVRVGGHSASALSDEPSPAVDAVVGGLRRRTGVRGRQRVGGALLGNRKKGDAERSGRGGVGSEG